MLLGLVPVVALIVLVLGGIYGGMFTPTEAGAAGALGAMVIALDQAPPERGRSSGKSSSETGQVSVSILFLIIAAEHVQPHAGAHRAAAGHGARS